MIYSIKHFFKGKVTNHYDGFYVLKQNNGSYLAVADNPGKFLGSHAVYAKEVSPSGETTKMYKTLMTIMDILLIQMIN